MSLIPVLCFTCGDDVISAVYEDYIRLVQERKKEGTHQTYFDKDLPNTSVEGTTLDELGIRKPCCRKHLLTHVDIY